MVADCRGVLRSGVEGGDGGRVEQLGVCGGSLDHKAEESGGM